MGERKQKSKTVCACVCVFADRITLKNNTRNLLSAFLMIWLKNNQEDAFITTLLLQSMNASRLLTCTGYSLAQFDVSNCATHSIYWISYVVLCVPPQPHTHIIIYLSIFLLILLHIILLCFLLLCSIIYNTISILVTTTMIIIMIMRVWPWPDRTERMCSCVSGIFLHLFRYMSPKTWRSVFARMHGPNLNQNQNWCVSTYPCYDCWVES